MNRSYKFYLTSLKPFYFLILLCVGLQASANENLCLLSLRGPAKSFTVLDEVFGTVNTLKLNGVPIRSRLRKRILNFEEANELIGQSDQKFSPVTDLINLEGTILKLGFARDLEYVQDRSLALSNPNGNVSYELYNIGDRIRATAVAYQNDQTVIIRLSSESYITELDEYKSPRPQPEKTTIYLELSLNN